MKATRTPLLYLIEENYGQVKSQSILVEVQESEEEPPVWFDTKILDGAAVVHLLPTINIDTFDEYANTVFISHIKKHLHTSKRVDVVWDTYITSSIKE